MSEHRRQILESQANQIEILLAQHDVSARVTGGLVFPRWIQFQLSPAVAEQGGRIKDLAGELASALNSPICHVSLRRGVAVEIPRPDPQPVRLLPLQRKLVRRQELPRDTVVIGLSDKGAPLLARLPSPQVGHLLIAGRAGSGKSALLRSIVASLALRHDRRQLGLLLISPRRNAFGSLAGLPHLLRPVSSQPEEIVRTLHSLVHRTASRCENGHSWEPRIVVAVDELSELLELPDAHAQVQGALAYLAQRGREAGIHLVACTQKPSSQSLDDLIQKRFPMRLTARLATQDNGGTKLPYRPGDFVVATEGRAIGFHAAYVSAWELAEITCQTLQAERGTHSYDRGGHTVPGQPAKRKCSLLRLYWELFRHWLSKEK